MAAYVRAVRERVGPLRSRPRAALLIPADPSAPRVHGLPREFEVRGVAGLGVASGATDSHSAIDGSGGLARAGSVPLASMTRAIAVRTGADNRTFASLLSWGSQPGCGIAMRPSRVRHRAAGRDRPGQGPARFGRPPRRPGRRP